MKCVILIVICCYFTSAYSQKLFYPSSKDSSKTFSIGAYLDVYLSTSNTKFESDLFPYFVSSNRLNSGQVNLGFLDLRYNSNRFRVKFAPGIGTYMDANYAPEPNYAKNILEGYLGWKILKSKNYWLDIGVFSSPFTNESAISKDHYFYTRSIAPEYVPYYIAGLKATIPLRSKFTLYGYMLNGWQQIKDQNNSKSLALQLEYKPTSSHLVNWDIYVGDESSSSQPNLRNRYFSDVYWYFTPPNARFHFVTCVYAGIQERLDGLSKKQIANWWQANFVLKYNFSSKQSLAARIEYFSDSKRVQLQSLVNSVDGMSLGSTGLCWNYTINKYMLIRGDARYYFSPNAVFPKLNGNPINSSFQFTGNMTLTF